MTSTTGYRPAEEIAADMTNANALPIQERLRDSPHALRLTREAADRIDALEKALDAAEALANEVQDLPDGPYHSMYAALCRYRVARAALEQPLAAGQAADWILDAALGEGE